jgi:hypothetical protein
MKSRCNPARVLVLAVTSAVVSMAIVMMPGIAGAQSSGEIDAIANELADGVYVELGGEGSEDELARVVRNARSVGLELSIVSLATSPPAEALASTLRDRVGGAVLVITPAEIAASSADHSDAAVNNAVNDSFDQFDNSVTSGAETFASSLAGSATGPTQSNTTPTSTSKSTSGSTSSSGGGGAGVLIFLLVVVGGIVGMVLFVRSKNRKKVKSEMAVRREEVTEELGVLGGEIYDMADTVAVKDIDKATEHFREGNEQYLQLQDDLDKATTLWEITKIDYAADTAAWHLDMAEAIINGDKLPDEPDRPDLRVSRPPDPNLPKPPRAETPPSPRVEPRQRRRSDWNAPRTRGGGLSGGLGNLITGVLVGSVLRGGGQSGGGRRAPRGWSGGGNLGGGRSSGGLGGPSRGGGSASRSRGGGGSASRRR